MVASYNEAKGIGALYALCACTIRIYVIYFHFVWYLQLSSKEAVQRVLKGEKPREKPSETLGKEKKKRSVVVQAAVHPLACN